MAIPVLLILVALWGIFFLWPLVSGKFGRTGGRALASVDRFRHGIGTFGRSGAHHLPRLGHRVPSAGRRVPSLGPLSDLLRPPTSPRRRRRQVLAIAAAVSVPVLLLALVTDATASWLLALVVCGPSLMYLAAVVRLEQAQRERVEKVRHLPVIEPPTRRVEPPVDARPSIAQPG